MRYDDFYLAKKMMKPETDRSYSSDLIKNNLLWIF